MLTRTGLISLFLFSAGVSLAQDSARIEGTVRNNSGKPLPFVMIGVLEYPELTTETDERGHFAVIIPSGIEVRIAFAYGEYENAVHTVTAAPGQLIRLDVTMRGKVMELTEVTITHEGERQKVSVIYLDPADVEEIPLPSGSIEQILKSIGLGLSTAGGELSSQYSVRGGNFDENLVYVNDFEIYRPLLIRGGQQEGLSFINPKLVRRLSFSSGGFDVRYGDKMSSVLDVNYKRPDSLAASLELSPLGLAMHFESGSDTGRWMGLIGVRHKTTRYLLSSLETKGVYSPSFYDVQSLVIHKFPSKANGQRLARWEMEWLTNVSSNSYRFLPEDRISSIGTIDNVKQLEVFFDGSERDQFQTYMSGLALTHIADSNRSRLKWLISANRSIEKETFDIIGDYFLYQVETNLGEEEFGGRLYGLGYGTYQNFARNYLTASVANIEHKGYRMAKSKRHVFEWGAKYQYESITDHLNDWNRQDSALYSLPDDPDSLFIHSYIKSDTSLTSGRVSAYLQDTWVIFKDTHGYANLTYGLRGHWWTVNKELVLSPRAQFILKPHTKKSIILKLATGLYQQPPFYRELRDIGGNLHPEVRAQKSLHVVGGIDYVFKIWQRDFRFISEAYYKYLWDLVPYDVEDVKIRYFAKNNARGYAMGIDFRLNGEFIPESESWITLSFLRTREDIEGDFYNVYLDTNGVEVFPGTVAFGGVADTVVQENGYLRRPTDQLVSFSMLFTDYLPSNKNFKVSLNMVFGSSLPFSPPNSVRYRNALVIPPYRRVDIGFSALLWDADRKAEHPTSFFRHFSKVWASLEVFNLLGIDNTISHIWINDNNGTLYAFENHLTGRLLNLRVIMKV